MAMSRLVAAVAVHIRLLFIIIIASAAAGRDLWSGVAPFRSESGRGGLTCQYKPRWDLTTVFHLLWCFFFLSATVVVLLSSCYLFFFYLFCLRSAFRTFAAALPAGDQRTSRAPVAVARGWFIGENETTPNPGCVHGRAPYTASVRPIDVVKAQEERQNLNLKHLKFEPNRAYV